MTLAERPQHHDRAITERRSRIKKRILNGAGAAILIVADLFAVGTAGYGRYVYTKYNHEYDETLTQANLDGGIDKAAKVQLDKLDEERTRGKNIEITGWKATGGTSLFLLGAAYWGRRRAKKDNIRRG